MAEDRDGNLWFGTDEGVWRYNGREWREFSPKDGLPARTVTALCMTRDGGVYAGTVFGIARFCGETWERVFPSEGDMHWPVYDLMEARDGSLWAGTAWGALRLAPEETTLYTTERMAAVMRVLASGVQVSVVPEKRLSTRPGLSKPVFYIHRGKVFRVTGGWAGIWRMGLSRERVAICGWIPPGDGGTDGLMVGDRVLEMDGAPPRTRSLLDPSGPAVTLTVQREGRPKPFEVVVSREGWDEISPDFSVYDVYEDREGAIWFALYEGEIIRYGIGGLAQDDSAAWRLYTAADGLDIGSRPHVTQTRDGIVWTVSDDAWHGVNRFDGQTWTSTRLTDVGGDNQDLSILETSDGTLWVGGKTYLHALRNGVWTAYSQHEIPIPRGARIVSLLEASDGTLWVAGLWKEAARLDLGTSRWQTYHGLFFQCETSEGSQWFLSRDNGVVRYDGQTWIRYGVEDGLMNAPIAVIPAGDGALWTAGSHDSTAATARFDGAQWSLRTHPALSWGVDHRMVYPSSDGSLWFGAAQDWFPERGHLGGLFQFDGKDWMHHMSPDLYTIGETADGLFWGGKNRLVYFDGKGWKGIIEPIELTQPWIQTICTTSQKTLWVGTRSYGVFHYDGTAWTRHDVRTGLPDNGIKSVSQTADGSIWVTTENGMSRFDGQNWATLNLHHDLADACVRQSRDGAIWFNWGSRGNDWVMRARPGTIAGWLGPPKVKTIRYEPDTTPPDTKITGSVDRVSQPGNTTLTWKGVDPWGRSDELRFSYRLDGGVWSPFFPEKSATFLSLGNGGHRFEVRSRDRDFNVDPSPAVLQFTVVPPVWRQPWFIGLMAVMLGAVGFQTVQVVRRDRRLQKSNADLEHEMAERERTEAERTRLDARLQHMQYLYRLRSALSEARSPEAAIHRTGEALIEALSATTSAGVRIEHDGRTWTFGESGREGLVRYLRLLDWGDRERGRLHLLCSVALSESQERTLLDETTGQLTRVLEARELEMQLLQSTRLISMGEIAAGVAHELNQPLGAISNTVSDIFLRLSEGLVLPEDELRGMMQDSMGVVNRMSGTIEHLRLFSRDTSDVPSTPFSMNEVVQSGLKLIGTQLKNHGIVLDVSLAEDLPSVLGHSHQMEQVVLNLLTNARDAVNERETSEGRWEKRVWVRTRSEDGRMILEVEDNGIGISDEYRGRLFEPFFTTKEADRGTGLGLSISYAIVKNHGGEIACESRRGEGSVFRVGVPVGDKNPESRTGG